MYCTNTQRIVIISIARVLAFVAAVNPRRARAPRTILGCSCPSTTFSRSSAYSTRTFITPTPVPNQTRVSAFLLLAQNSFPSLNVHTGVPPTEEARRRENVCECRKLLVGLGTDGRRVDSGLFELAGTVDGCFGYEGHRCVGKCRIQQYGLPLLTSSQASTCTSLST